MDKALRPDRFDVDPNSQSAAKQWKHWLFSFKHYLSSVKASESEKFIVLANHVSPDIFEYIADCSSFDDAITILEKMYIKPVNIIYARHILTTCRQESGQTLEQFLNKLKLLAKDCCFKAVTADEYLKETIRDAFIRGIQSKEIRKRLLEFDTLDLDKAFSCARTLESAETQSFSYMNPQNHGSDAFAVQSICDAKSDDFESSHESKLAATTVKCYFCGFSKHPRSKCPAREATCKKCNKVGHFQRVCQSVANDKRFVSSLCTTSSAALPNSLSQAIVKLTVNNIPLHALIDTGSSDNYISASTARKHSFHIHPSSMSITMASTTHSSSTKGHCLVDIVYENNHYPSVKLSVLPNLCSDVLLGHDFLKQHERLDIRFGGSRPPLSVCALIAAHIDTPTLFGSLTPNCKPITTKSRLLSFSDQSFVDKEIHRLLMENIIEPSQSPWRAQVLVTSNANHKRRMVVDYSRTINRFTLFDAYPLPRINELVEKISHYDIFTTVDLKSAYHQIPIREDEKAFTAFEACGNLYQFR